jgi:hypothetical protein
MKRHRESLTPWRLVERRWFGGEMPDVLAFSHRHKLNVVEVFRLFAGDIISFSNEMCEALSRETKMSKDFFRNLSNNWPPHPPPAASMALSVGPFLLFNLKCNGRCVAFV